MSQLPKIVLLGLQLLAAWYLGEAISSGIVRALQITQSNAIFVSAVVYPAIVMLVGHTGAKVLKEVRAPSGATLIATFGLAILLAALTLVPQVTQVAEGLVPSLRTSRYIYPLVGAFAGYYLKK